MGIGIRTLDDLAKECLLLGLTPVASGKKLLKRDYVKVLRDHYLRIKYPDGKIPRHLQYMISLDTPMLCARMSECKPHIQEHLWNSPEVVAQRKLDGIRMVAVYSKEEGLHLYSRNISVTDYSPQDYFENTHLWDFDPSKLETFGVRSFILDTEVTCPRAKVSTLKSSMEKRGVITETVLQAVAALLQLNAPDSVAIQKEQDIHLEFQSFHLLEFNGHDFRTTELRHVLPELTKVIELVKLSGLSVHHVPVISESKRAYYESIITSGGEGIILKTLNSLYRNTESRAHREWVKAKTTVSQSMTNAGLGDTVDAFVTGFGRGDADTSFKDLVGYLIFSVWLLKADGTRELHEIAHTANMDLVERKRISMWEPLTGTLKMDPAYLGRVGVIDGQGISPRAKRLTHPRLIEWRMGDKQPDQCVMEEAFLDKLIGTDNTAATTPTPVDVVPAPVSMVTEVGF